MGWTYTHRPTGQSLVDFFKAEFPSMEFLETATKSRVFYAACRYKSDSVFGLVCLIDYAPRDHHNTGYKDMSEDCGPCESECPERILNLLTPTESEWANEWRTRCREYNERQKTVMAKPKPADRDVLKFAKPIKFTNGDTEDTFEIHYERRKVTFRSHPDGYGHYRISKWREREFEILPKAA